MADIKQLLDEVRKHYDVVLLEYRGTTAGNKIHEYDLWYMDKTTEAVRYKRLHIYKDQYGNAFWYSENPIPRQTTSKSWTQIMDEKIESEIVSKGQIVHWTIESIDEGKKRAILKAWAIENNQLIEKKMVVAQKSDGSWDIRIF